MQIPRSHWVFRYCFWFGPPPDKFSTCELALVLLAATLIHVACAALAGMYLYLWVTKTMLMAAFAGGLLGLAVIVWVMIRLFDWADAYLQSQNTWMDRAHDKLCKTITVDHTK